MAPPAELIGDVVGQILLRIPPGESAYLVRASKVCKLWRRILSDPDFTRRYRAFHRTPPLLGFLQHSDSGDRLFYPTMAVCPFPQSAFDYCSRWSTLDDRHRLCAVDCRHGRVLLQLISTRKFIVWDPITGGREELPEPRIPHIMFHFHSGMMVLCAAAGSDHRNYLGGPFLVVLVYPQGSSVHGCVYSSKARAWGRPVSVSIGNGVYYISASAKRGALVGDNAYFTLHKLVFGGLDGFTLPTCKASKILKYDLGKNFLSVIIDLDLTLEIDTSVRDAFVMPMEDGSLGFVGIKDSSIYLWRWKVDVDPEGVEGWLPCRVIGLEKLLNISCDNAEVVAFAEGVGVVFVRIGTSLFMIELKSEQVRKATSELSFHYTILPFMSFYTSGSTSSSLPLPAEKNNHS